MENDTFWAVVIFDTDPIDDSIIKYKIRMNASRTQDTGYAQDPVHSFGPRNCFTCNPYFLHGFIYIQDLIERALIDTSRNSAGLDDLDLTLSAQMTPYPCHISDKFLVDISKSLPLFMVIAWVYTVSTLVKDMVYEKEKRLKEFMHVMGLANFGHKLAWFLTSFMATLFTNILVCFILKFGNTIIFSDSIVLLLFFTCFQLATISQCFLISSMFSKSSLASIVAGIVYFLLYLPYNMLTSYGEAVLPWHKMLASVSSTVGFSYGCELMANYEMQNVGLQWSNFFSTPLATKGLVFVRIFKWLCFLPVSNQNY